MMTIEVTPAQWRQENNQYVVKKMGYILLSFFEMSEDMRIDGASKKSFVLTPRNMDTLLDLDPKAAYNEADSNEEVVLYKPVNSALVSILKIAKQQDRSYVFTYCEMPDDDGNGGSEEIQSYNELSLKPGQVRMLQVIAEFALPSLSGINAI